MAKQGYNICIVGRNPEKIAEKQKTLEAEFSRETRSVVADFSKMFTIEEYKE